MSDRKRTILVSALNVAMHRPHSPQRYVDLFKAAFNAGQFFQQGEIHGLLFGSLQDTVDAVEKNELIGEVYRFVKVDANEPWFDTRTKKQATSEEVDQINIPQHLLAHMQQIPFVFYPRQHELWFVSKDRKDSLPITVAERFFQKLLEKTAMANNFPEVAVTALPDFDALDEVLGLPDLHHIELSFKRPNPDDAGGIEAIFEERLANMNVRTRHETLTAVQGQVLQPDEQLRAEAAVAARNGNVMAKGRNEYGITIQATTAQKPRKIYMQVNSAIETGLDVLRRAFST